MKSIDDNSNNVYANEFNISTSWLYKDCFKPLAVCEECSTTREEKSDFYSVN